MINLTPFLALGVSFILLLGSAFNVYRWILKHNKKPVSAQIWTARRHRILHAIFSGVLFTPMYAQVLSELNVQVWGTIGLLLLGVYSILSTIAIYVGTTLAIKKYGKKYTSDSESIIE